MYYSFIALLAFVDLVFGAAPCHSQNQQQVSPQVPRQVSQQAPQQVSPPAYPAPAGVAGQHSGSAHGGGLCYNGQVSPTSGAVSGGGPSAGGSAYVGASAASGFQEVDTFIMYAEGEGFTNCSRCDACTRGCHHYSETIDRTYFFEADGSRKTKVKSKSLIRKIYQKIKRNKRTVAGVGGQCVCFILAVAAVTCILVAI